MRYKVHSGSADARLLSVDQCVSSLYAVRTYSVLDSKYSVSTLLQYEFFILLTVSIRAIMLPQVRIIEWTWSYCAKSRKYRVVPALHMLSSPPTLQSQGPLPSLPPPHLASHSPWSTGSTSVLPLAMWEDSVCVSDTANYSFRSNLLINWLELQV